MTRTPKLLATLLAALIMTARAEGGVPGREVIELFPRDVGEFGYADIGTGRRAKWFPALGDLALPPEFRALERLLGTAGIDPWTQVEDLAWGGIPAGGDHPEELVGVAMGEFRPEDVEARLRRVGLRPQAEYGFALYGLTSGLGASDIFFFFLDANTAVFGQRDAVNRLLAVRFADEPSLLDNPVLLPLIDGEDGQGLIWAVLDQHYAQLGLQQLLPAAISSGLLPSTPYRGLRGMTLSVDDSSEVQIRIEALCGSPGEADDLAVLLQAALLYEEYQASKAAPDNTDSAGPGAALETLLDQSQLAPSGDRVGLTVRLAWDQVDALLRRRTFAFQR